MPNIASLVKTKILRMGASGLDVKQLQLALRTLGYGLNGTGFFGTSTDAAVEAFQKKWGLTPDGEVGTATATAIDSAISAPKPGTGPLAPLAVASRPLWLEAGLKYVGVKELAGGRDNPTILDWAKEEGGSVAATYTHDSIPWCALFANMTLTKADLKGPETLWALDFNADRMKARLGRAWPAVRLAGPAVGAFAPMLRNGGGHIIIVVGKDQHGNIMGLGGNQSDKVSIIPFPLSRLNEGFWWPKDTVLPQMIGVNLLPVVKSDGRVSSKES